jgi:ABC-2 type transport system ATP-binding protein
MNTNIIETHGLTKGAGSQLRVNHIDLRVPEGCVYGFLGPNGAGKTTTLKLPEGTITLLGKKMTSQNRLALLKHTGSLIESPSFYGHLTGLENLQIIAKLKKEISKKIS